MNSKIEKLPFSRVKITVTAQADDIKHAADHAFQHVTAQTSVKGFRPGKAPRPLLVQTVGKGRILSELVDHALPELLQHVAREHTITIIEAPAYTLEKLCELQDDGSVKPNSPLIFTAEADYAPEVKVGNYQKIKLKPTKVEEVTDKVINDALNQLAERRVEFAKVDRPAKNGDRVEIDFAGKRGGIPEDRLASKHYPIILGSNVMIPGFEDELVGKKASASHAFEITFPQDYHAKDLAGEKVVFDVTVHSVEEKKLPEINDAFAKQVGYKSLKELKEAIKQEREFAFTNRARETDQAAVLEAFLPLVKVDIPKSLVERELDRQVDAMREQAQSLGVSFDDYLKHLKKTEEELREELRASAEKAVTIGLGLGDVVEKEGLKGEQNPGVAAIEKLVEIATATSKSKETSVK